MVNKMGRVGRANRVDRVDWRCWLELHIVIIKKQEIRKLIYIRRYVGVV